VGEDLSDRGLDFLAMSATNVCFTPKANVLTVALANKLAPIALTVLLQGRNYETRIKSVAA
jgi:hypothetical protein